MAAATAGLATRPACHATFLDLKALVRFTLLEALALRRGRRRHASAAIVAARKCARRIDRRGIGFKTVRFRGAAVLAENRWGCWERFAFTVVRVDDGRCERDREERR